ncbi:MAG: tRNA (adenosine(37)-N6)-dimethylallyltransferase MiaA [Gemmatimonadaceae bacterium]|nr:tRNA (adenosine(37)-N6)-dimethylallyltransferase MiaA [Gloeobacterales cyanobacterium ES-bin-141]
MHSSKTLLVLCGPTATGKSGLAQQLAHYLNVPVLNADSRQVYRGFDIGTAKPTAQERLEVEHLLIDVADPTENFNAIRYQALANTEIERLHREGRVALLVGGSGLYLRAVSMGLTPPAVPPDPKLRAHLQPLTASELHHQLQAQDPDSARRIHPNDRVRLERALEVCLSTGQPLSAQQSRHPPDYAVRTIGLCAERSLLTERIAARTYRMLARGWLEEVACLRERYGSDLPLLQTLGYGELGSHLAGDMSLEAAIERTIIRTRQFAKRQMTWFRADSTIQWLDISAGEQSLWEQTQRLVDGL